MASAGLLIWATENRSQLTQLGQGVPEDDDEADYNGNGINICAVLVTNPYNLVDFCLARCPRPRSEEGDDNQCQRTFFTVLGLTKLCKENEDSDGVDLDSSGKFPLVDQK